MKRIVCFFLAMTMLLLLAGCSKDKDAPDGYKLASNKDTCKYTLYVPESWICEVRETNYTTATVSSTDRSNISMAQVTDVVSGESFADFWGRQKNQYTALFGESFSVVSEAEAVKLGGRNAFRCIFTASYDGVSYKYMQIFVTNTELLSSELYVFTYTASAAKYDENLEAVNAVLSYVQWN